MKKVMLLISVSMCMLFITEIASAGYVQSRKLYYYFLYDETTPEFDPFADNEFIWP